MRYVVNWAEREKYSHCSVPIKCDLFYIRTMVIEGLSHGDIFDNIVIKSNSGITLAIPFNIIYSMSEIKKIHNVTIIKINQNIIGKPIMDGNVFFDGRLDWTISWNVDGYHADFYLGCMHFDDNRKPNIDATYCNYRWHWGNDLHFYEISEPLIGIFILTSSKVKRFDSYNKNTSIHSIGADTLKYNFMITMPSEQNKKWLFYIPWSLDESVAVDIMNDEYVQVTPDKNDGVKMILKTAVYQKIK